MKKIRFVLLFAVLPFFSMSQKTKTENDENKVFAKVELDAGPVNQADWLKFLNKIAILPNSISQKIPAGRYEVTVQFIIDTHGYIGQVQVLQDPGYELAQRVVRMLKSYPGEWKPASQCGRLVKAYRKQNFIFEIE